MTNWTIDEMEFARPEHLDPEFVAGFDLKQGADDIDDIGLLEGDVLEAGSCLWTCGAGRSR